MRLQAHRPGAEGEIADAGLDPRVEGFYGHARHVDPDHFAGLGAAETCDADDVAEFYVSRQAGDAKGRGTDLGDDAADAHRIEPQFGFLHVALQLLQSPHDFAPVYDVAPSVLIAS